MAPVKEPRIGPSLTRHDASKWVSSIRSIRSVPGSAERSTSGSMSAVHTAFGSRLEREFAGQSHRWIRVGRRPRRRAVGEPA